MDNKKFCDLAKRLRGNTLDPLYEEYGFVSVGEETISFFGNFIDASAPFSFEIAKTDPRAATLVDLIIRNLGSKKYADAKETRAQSDAWRMRREEETLRWRQSLQRR